MKKVLKNNYKIIIGVIVGIVSSGTIGVAASILLSSGNVAYNNTNSGLKSTTLQGAIDELYEKSNNKKQGKFISAYVYNELSGASNYCVMGEEETCEKNTKCITRREEGDCKPGDIIKYKVNNSTIVTFHVMYDDIYTITMMSQSPIVNNTAWYQESGISNKGPLTILTALENATSGWNYVIKQKYSTSATVCSSYNDCRNNAYSYTDRTAQARMLTVQEAVSLGCTSTSNSCPKWITEGTVTMNIASSVGVQPYFINGGALFSYSMYESTHPFSTVAIVKVNK